MPGKCGKEVIEPKTGGERIRETRTARIVRAARLGDHWRHRAGRGGVDDSEGQLELLDRRIQLPVIE